MENPYVVIISILTGIVILIIVLVIANLYNTLIHLKRNIERSYSVIDVYLKKRYDLIPNLVETVKGYAKYEESTLKQITELRTQYTENNDQSAEKELNKYYRNMLAVVEAYPTLKSSEQYLNLQKQLTKVESEIQAARRLYINSITEYNNLVTKFPSNIFAKLFGHKLYNYPQYEIHDVKINFN